MAAYSHFACHDNPTIFHHHHHPCPNSFRSQRSSHFHLKARNQRTPFPRVSVSSRKQVEIVYDPDERINKLADEVDKDSAPVSRLTLFSPCKINVFLRITDKRADGFHDLASLFHVISLGDVIKFSLSPSKTTDRLSTNVSGVPLDDRNLIIKALNLYRKKTGSNNFFWIHLDKKVPTGAGLGGGSSNAATALWAANQFNGFLATNKELQEWSSEIGSDVPFFFSQGAAYCTGRGEVVQNIPPPISLDIPMVLIKPQQACSTAEVYKRLQLGKTSKVDPLMLLEKISRNGISQDVCINDLEPPAFEVLPSLRRLKQRVLAASRGQYGAVFMSGSILDAVEALLLGLVLEILPNSYMTTMNTRMCFCQRPTFSLVKEMTGIKNLLRQVPVAHPPIFLGDLVLPRETCGHIHVVNDVNDWI